MFHSSKRPCFLVPAVSQSLVLCMISFALAAASGCTPQGAILSVSGQADSFVREDEREVCVSLEGNGENFSSHISALVALMEQGLNPRVVAGGSSGAVVAGLVRALLSNPTLGDVSQKTPSVQNAARVLAAGKPVFESLLFLPTLDDLRTAVSSLALTLVYVGLGRGFVSNPDYAVAHAEAIVAQNLIAIQFFRDTDFASVLAEPDYHKRLALVQSLWESEFGFLRVSPAEFVLAMLTPDQHASESEIKRHREIRRRYFALFDSPTKKSGQLSPQEMLEKHEAFLSNTVLLNSARLRDSAVQIYEAAVEAMRPLLFVGALSATVDKPFLLPDPEVLSKAIQGLDKDGNVMKIPDGAVIHTTARQGELRLAVPGLFPKREFADVDIGSFFQRIDDMPGFKNLYQIYFSNEEMTEALQKAQLDHADSGLLFYTKERKAVPVLQSNQHAQAIGGLNLSQALSLSVSEPGFFRRIPFRPSELKLADDVVVPALFRDPDTFLVSYGGWLDTSASQTLALLPHCDPERIDHFAYVHPNRLENEFQRNAVTELNNRASREERVDVQEIMMRIREYLVHSRTVVTARKPSLDLSWNWDDPVGEGSSLSRELRQNRGLYLYSAHSAYREILRESLAAESFAPSAFESVPDVNVVDELQKGVSLKELEQRIYGK